MRYVVIGRDEYGNPKLEEIEYQPPPKRSWLFRFLSGYVFVGRLWNLGYKLGYHNMRQIKYIHVEE